MSKIIVLGAGMVGGAIARDLAPKHSVTSADLNERSLKKLREADSAIATIKLDVTDAGALKNAINEFDLVVCAVPGFLGFRTLKSIIESGKNVIDISFFPENSLDLHDLAVSKGVTAITDTGVAPGMDNYILGYWNEKLKLTDFECLVGGLPKVRKWPFNYKAPFSPVDVIEEYTRPARYVENGTMVTKSALSDIEHLEFEGVGTLESFNSDGLRSIIHTMSHIPNMKEKTLRYPGHADQIRVLRDSGFFNTNELDFKGTKIRPIDFTSRILFDEWKLGDEEEELTVMRVTVKGTDRSGKRKEIVYSLLDEYDTKTKTSSMARTTGYTATAAANMFLEGHFGKKGVFPPELVGSDPICFNYILNYLAERNVIYHVDEREV